MSDAWPLGDGGSTAVRIHRIPKTVAKQEVARDGQDNRQGGNEHPRVYEDAVQLLRILEEYPPTDCRWQHAQSKETQGCFPQD